MNVAGYDRVGKLKKRRKKTKMEYEEVFMVCFCISAASRKDDDEDDIGDLSRSAKANELKKYLLSTWCYHYFIIYQ